jgi:hypothetical protein
VSQQDYAIHYAPLFTTLQAMDVQKLIEQVDDPWYNLPSPVSAAPC